MKLKKEYLTLSEAAKKMGPDWSAQDVVHLGATGHLPIFVVPDDWLAHIYGIGPLEYQHHGDEALEERDASLPSPMFEAIAEKKSIAPWTLSKPVQLLPGTLQRLEVSPSTQESRFIAPNPDNHRDFIRLEYRIQDCAGAETSASVDLTALIVYAADLQKHLQNSGAEEDKPLGTRERTSLQIMIAALAKQAKVDLTHPSAAADSIQHLADLMGKHIGLTTIENHVKNVPDELRAWTKHDSHT